jgi:hypothetical protein
MSTETKERTPLAIRLYNASLASRELPTVEDWASIHPDIRKEFEAIAKAARK